MKIKKKHLGEVHRVTAENGTTHKLLIEDTEACIKMAKILNLDIFVKDAVKKEPSKSKRSSNTNGEDNDK